jgi:uncharacterized membrane protein required for colicin V production
MNWSDWLVIGLILGFAIIGMVKGFILSIFRLVSFFVSIVISIKFYPVVAAFLKQTALYTGLKASILKNLLLQQQAAPKVDSQVKKAAAQTVIEGLQLPGFLKDVLEKQFPDPSKLINLNDMMDKLSGMLAGVVVDVISLVVLYILIRIALAFVRVILNGIAKLPVFKQMDKVGGFSLGAVEGLLTVYILCAVVMLFHTAPQFKGIFEAIDSSLVAKFFYENNFIVNWMFPSSPPPS